MKRKEKYKHSLIFSEEQEYMFNHKNKSCHNNPPQILIVMGIAANPCNSQGELVQLHCSGKGGLNQKKKQSTLMVPANHFPVHDHSNVKEKHLGEAVFTK